MSTLDATAGESGLPAHATELAPAAPAPVVGPMAGDPAMLGLGSFIVGSVALGLSLVGVVPAGVLGAPLAIILSATALGLLLLLIAYANASAAGVPSSGLIKFAGYVILVFAALGVYLFFGAAAAGTGGNSLPLGKPLMR